MTAMTEGRASIPLVVVVKYNQRNKQKRELHNHCKTFSHLAYHFLFDCIKNNHKT